MENTKKRPDDVVAYLNVPFEEKDEARLLGARWDSYAKAWYSPLGKDLKLFSKWLGSEIVTEIKKVYLNVPFEEKDEAKKMGARWDNDKKKWYVLSTADLENFKKWI